MTDATILNKLQVLTCSDFNFDYVDVPEWGGRLRVRGLSGEERTFCDKVMRDAEAGKSGPNTYAAALITCGTVDDQGASVFARSDIAALSKKADHVLQRVGVRILQLSGATPSAQVETEKN